MAFTPWMSYTPRLYEDKAMYLVIFGPVALTSWRVEIPDLPGTPGFHIELEINPGESKYLGLTPTGIGLGDFVQSQMVRIGWRSRPLAALRNITVHMENADGESGSFSIRTTNNFYPNVPGAIIATVDGLGNCVATWHHNAQVDYSTTQSNQHSAVRHFPFRAANEPGDLVTEISPYARVVVTAMGPGLDGCMWMLRRRKNPLFLGIDDRKYWRGAWGIATTAKTIIEPGDWLNDSLDVEGAIVWQSENVVWADAILGIDGSGLSVAVWVDDDGNSKLLFKRAPALSGPWPDDSEASVIRDQSYNGSVIPLMAYRLLQTPSGRLVVTHVLSSYYSDDGGSTWDFVGNA